MGGTRPLEKCLPSLKKSIAHSMSHSIKQLCIYFTTQKTPCFIMLF